MISTTETKALIWHEAALFKGSDDGDLRAALAVFRDQGLSMAVVTTGDPGQLRGTLLRQNLSAYFAHDASKVAVFSTVDHETTVHDHALTGAFAQTLQTLGTDRHVTIAVVEDCEQVRRARYAGLPVLGYTNAPLPTRERMVDYGARFAASAAIDLEDAVLQFRPFREAKWHPMAAPRSSL